MKATKLYRESICAFISCKMVKKNYLSIPQTIFLSLPIWKNILFTCKNKQIYFENWKESGTLHVKDLHDVNGCFNQIN